MRTTSALAFLLLAVPVTSQLRTAPPAVRPSVFEGFVLEPGGAPARDAVVTCSAGGQAVTDVQGRYRLRATIPAGATAVRITAVGAGAANTVASAEVPWPPATDPVTAGPLLLVEQLGCDPSWLPTFGGPAGTSGWVLALATFDDGRGPALYVGGGFLTAGGVFANRIARWDGFEWEAVGAGMDGDVLALEVFDDGGGPALFAGGRFTAADGGPANRVARWDGSSWTPLGSGMNDDVNDLVAHDDGSGPRLYAAGTFTNAGGNAALRVARWDGAGWSPVLGGANNEAKALASYGGELYLGGRFTSVDDVAAFRVARFDGSSWAPVGSGIGGVGSVVNAMAVLDDGSGPVLCAAGLFPSVGGIFHTENVARWDGAVWSGLSGSSIAAEFYALTVFDDGNGPALYAGLRSVGGAGGAGSRVKRWSSGWSDVGAVSNHVYAVAPFDDGTGPRLAAGGAFPDIGPPVNHVSIWDGAEWARLGGDGFNSRVDELVVFDDGSGPALYASGPFSRVGDVTLPGVGRWDGSSWEPVGGSSVHSLTVLDDGLGPVLYGIAANQIVRWNGSAWSTFADPLPGALTLAVFDDGGGPAVHAGGSYGLVAGWDKVLRWNGSAWVGLGPVNSISGQVRSMAVFDDGTGPALYVGGEFSQIYNVPAGRVARWNGGSWSAVGGGVGGNDDSVETLLVHDDGNGPALYAGGDFSTVNGVPSGGLARWDGVSWSPVGGGLDGRVEALAAADDGRGPALFACGPFTLAGGTPALHVARWDGSGWSAMGSGLNELLPFPPAFGPVFALVGFDGRRGPALYAGGSFLSVDSRDTYLARWTCRHLVPPAGESPTEHP